MCFIVVVLNICLLYWFFKCVCVSDHCVHYYDLRQPRQPLSVFRGHKKAVSYVKFLNDTELVSA
jgi:hypothetical protein